MIGSGKASASSDRPAFDPHFSQGSFSKSSHTSDLKIGTPVATLPGAWHQKVTAGMSVINSWMQHEPFVMN